MTQVRAGNLKLDAVIDTGTEITIGNMALRNQLIRRNRASFVTIETIGVTGKPLKLELARVGLLELGPVTLRDVPMAFADVPPFKLFGLLDQPAILLGTDVLEHFRKVSLDFRSRKVRFQLRRCAGTIVVFNSAPDRFGGTISGSKDACVELKRSRRPVARTADATLTIPQQRKKSSCILFADDRRRWRQLHPDER